MIRKEDVINIAINAYRAGHEDTKKGVYSDDCSTITDMVEEVIADCESYNEKLN